MQGDFAEVGSHDQINSPLKLDGSRMSRETSGPNSHESGVTSKHT